MATVINIDADLHRKLNEHARRQPVPTTNGRLAKAIISSVITAADSEGVDAGQIIRRLLSPSHAGGASSTAIAA